MSFLLLIAFLSGFGVFTTAYDHGWKRAWPILVVCLASIAGAVLLKS